MISYVFIDKNGHKKARTVKNRKEYFAIRNTEANKKNFAAARAGNKKAKMALKQFNYNDLLPDGVLKGCHHAASTFAHDIDCGSEASCRDIAQRILDKKSDIGLLELSVSSGWGLHVICKRELGKTILENQVRLAVAIEAEMDTSAHDQQRVMFTGPASDDVLLYLDDAIFAESLDEAASAEEFRRIKEREQHGQEGVPPGAKKANKHYRPWEESPAVPIATPATALSVASFKGVPYQQIVDEWWAQSGGIPQAGERNVKLYQLAVNLRAICDNKKQLVLSVLPRLGLDEGEVDRIVESACKEPPKGLSKAMLCVLKAIGVENPATQDVENRKAAEQAEQLDEWLWDWGEQIEQLFPYFPMLQDACKGLKRNQYPAALVVSGALSMTLMTRCTYRFYHRPEERRRLNSSALIIGDPASGKSFATRLYKLLAAPILTADRVGKDAINAYREQMKTKGANKEKPKKPKVAIRIHPARTSNAQFIQDMVNSVEEVDGTLMQLHMLTFDTELDNTLCIQKGGSWIDKQSLELKAFHNEEDGQFYSNMDSVIENFVVTWNYVYTGTPLALKAKVNDRNFGSGLPTRLTCVPLPATNFKMLSRETTVDVESDKRISEWAERLDKTKGELPLQKIVDELFDWTARRMADAEENNSKAEEMLLKRCAYHAINFSAPFIVMRHWGAMKRDGEFWQGAFETDEIDWRLAELIVNIQYACQRHYFLAMAEKYFDDQMRDITINRHRSDKTIEAFNRLPEEFYTTDVMHNFSLSTEAAARSRVQRLMRDHLIEKVAELKEKGSTRVLYRKTNRIMR